LLLLYAEYYGNDYKCAAICVLLMAERPVAVRPKRKIAALDVTETMKKLEEGIKMSAKVDRVKLKRELRPPEEFFKLRQRRG